MDHIQLPLGGLEAIQVPYVSSHTFDCNDFATFPTRAGFPLIDDGAGWLEVSTDKIAAILQSWLYFGLITTFLGQEISLEKFIVGDGTQRRLVTSAALFPLLDHWSVSAPHSDTTEQERLEGLLRLATTTLKDLSRLPQSALSPLPEIILSVHLLITTLGAAASGGNGLAFAELVPRPNTDTPAIDPAAELLTRNLLRAGWCPWKARQIVSEYSYLTIYYISRLRDPTAPHITHSACTDDRCIGNNVDMANYSTRHVEPTCACSHSPMPDEEMRSIIADGGIPIARIKISSSDSPYLQVKRAGPRSQYIAVSHVWSDGLGNPHANWLPQCQLTRLRDSLKLLAPPMFDFGQGYIAVPQLNLGVDIKRMMVAWGSTEWFWLDTLCIPVGADDQSILLKSKAINQMAAIYAGAHQVLVLDSVLQTSNVIGRDACHVLAQLSAVAWLGRCWTYQEGALALSLQVQCADCSFDPALFDNIAVEDSASNEEIYILLPGTTTVGSSWHRIWQALLLGIKRAMDTAEFRIAGIRRIPAPLQPKLQSLLTGHVYSQITEVVSREMRYDRRGPDSLLPSWNTMEDFVLCWNSLAQRTTTMAGDIHVIIANLLRLNAFSILEMKTHEERMRAILWSLPAIPLSLLFNKSKERVRPTEQHANRWMPLWPDRSTLSESPALRIQGGVLTLATDEIEDEHQKPKLLMLGQLFRTGENATELLVSDDSGPHVEWYRVVFHRQQGDQFDSSGFHSTVFVLGPITSHASIPAACLHVNALFHKHPAPDDTAVAGSCQSHSPSSELQLLTTFDCPATICPLNSITPPEYANLPQYSATSPSRYTLAIQHGKPPSPTPKHRHTAY